MITSIGYKSLGRSWIDDVTVDLEVAPDLEIKWSGSSSQESFRTCVSAIAIADNQLFLSVESNLISYLAAVTIASIFDSKGRNLSDISLVAGKEELAIIKFPLKVADDILVPLSRNILSLFSKSVKFAVFDSINIAEYFGSSKVGDILSISRDEAAPNDRARLFAKRYDIGNIIGGVGSAFMNYSRVSGHFVEVFVVVRKATLTADCVISLMRTLEHLRLLNMTELSNIVISDNILAKSDNFLASTELMYT